MVKKKKKYTHDDPLGIEELRKIRRAVRDQNPFRRMGNRWHDYYDQNQVNDVLRSVEAELGVAPVIEPYCHVAINSNIGIWAKNRTDYTVLADIATEESDLISEATAVKVNSIEKRSGAEQAVTDAYKSVLISGEKFLGISLCKDPFKFPVKIKPVMRGEIFWDMSDPHDRTLQDAKWLVREKYVNIKECKAHIESIVGKKIKDADLLSSSFSLREESDYTGLELLAYLQESRGTAVEEKPLFKKETGEILLSEILYRRWAKTRLVRTADGRVFDADYFPSLPDYDYLLNGAEFFEEVTSRVRQAWAIGEEIINDGFSPIFRDDFHYVPFFGYIEDRTGTPYGMMKSMLPMQDEVNLRSTLYKYLMSTFRTIRPDEMFIDDDETLRLKFGRGDADIVFDGDWVEKHPVSAQLFRLDHVQDVTQEQYQRLQDAKNAIFAVAGITPEWLGRSESKNDSGVKYNQMIEQTGTVSAGLIDHFNFSRKNLGRLILDLAIDSIKLGETVNIEDDLEVKTEIKLNNILEDGHVENDIYRYSLQVALSDIPTSPSFKAQQASLLTDAIESAPEQAIPILYPAYLKSLQVPNAVKIAQEVAKVMESPTEKDIQERIDQAVKESEIKNQYDLKREEVELKKREQDGRDAEYAAKLDKLDADIKKILADVVEKTLTSMFTATRAAQEIASTPALVPVADELYRSAGGEDKNPAPVFTPVAATGTGLVDNKEGSINMEAPEKQLTETIPQAAHPQQPEPNDIVPNEGIETT